MMGLIKKDFAQTSAKTKESFSLNQKKKSPLGKKKGKLLFEKGKTASLKKRKLFFEKRTRKLFF